MSLKPQDIVIILKLFSYGYSRPSYAVVASELFMSASEVHSGIQRLKKSRLVNNDFPNVSALEEYLIHGVKYSFPAERGAMTRGVPTSYAAEPLCHLVSAGLGSPPVWPYVHGTTRGMALTPLYRTVPQAALNDSELYMRLALVDAIREGRARERNLAVEELKRSLKQTNG